jgi:hypothetical protein
LLDRTKSEEIAAPLRFGVLVKPRPGHPLRLFGVGEREQGEPELLSRSLELWSNFDTLPELLEHVVEVWSFAQDDTRIVTSLSKPRTDLNR